MVKTAYCAFEQRHLSFAALISKKPTAGTFLRHAIYLESASKVAKRNSPGLYLSHYNQKFLLFKLLWLQCVTLFGHVVFLANCVANWMSRYLQNVVLILYLFLPPSILFLRLHLLHICTWTTQYGPYCYKNTTSNRFLYNLN